MAPDGSRQIKATVPPGMKAGDTFLIRLALPIRKDVFNAKPMEPPLADPQQPLFSQALEKWLTPYPDAAVISTCANMVNNTQRKDPRSLDGAVPTSIANATAPTPMVKNTNALNVTPAISPNQKQVDPSPRMSGSHWNDENEQAEAREGPETRSSKANNLPLESTAAKQKLLLVHVPSGMPEGATMQVEVPGENRTLTTQVPPGVSSFHVAYSPRPPTQPTASFSQPTEKARSSRYSPDPTSPLSSTQLPPKSTFKTRATTPKGQKLLLVRVPKGTAAGTTLHVSVPDEPGRILAAKVPPGNVQEFHVSYEARPPKKPKETEQPKSQYQRSPTPSQTHQQQHQQSQHQPVQEPRYEQQRSTANANTLTGNGNIYSYQQESSMEYRNPAERHQEQQQQHEEEPYGSPVYQARNQQQRQQEYPSPPQKGPAGGWGGFMLPFFGGGTLGTPGATNNNGASGMRGGFQY